MKTPLQTQRSLHPAIPLLWLGLAVWGTLAMMSAANKPGPAGAPPAKWPMGAALPHPAKRPTLVMFVQPDCGCTKASVAELSLLMKSCQEKVTAYVLLLKSPRQQTDWFQSDLQRQIAAVPGVNIAYDENGRQARLFGVETSGEVVLYEADGRLRFRGGVTASRGHAGDNLGCTALQALIAHHPCEVTQTPVFGCPLFAGNLTATR